MMSKFFQKLASSVTRYKFPSKNPYPSLWKSTPPLWWFLGRLYPRPFFIRGFEIWYAQSSFKPQVWYSFKVCLLFSAKTTMTKFRYKATQQNIAGKGFKVIGRKFFGALNNTGSLLYFYIPIPHRVGTRCFLLAWGKFLWAKCLAKLIFWASNMLMLCLCDGAICTLWVFFCNLGMLSNFVKLRLSICLGYA